MATTDTPATFGELQTALLNLLKEVTGITAVTNVASRYINTGLHDMMQERWWWAERFDRLELHDDYTTGTVSIALATRTTVTGASTLWNTAVTGMGFNNARAGGKMTFAGSNDVYRVTSVGSDTAITLDEPFIGAAALSGAAYVYFEDEYALAADFDDEHGVLDAINFYANRELRVIPSSELYRRYPRNSTLATSPRVATIVHRGPSGSVTRRPRLLVAPPPNQLIALPYRYYTRNLAVSTAGVGAENLSATDDEPIVPLKWRYGIVLKAAEHYARDRKNDPRSAEYKGQYEALMLRARASQDAADNRPRIEPRLGGYRARARRPYSGMRTGRWATGTWFDELRDVGD
jgi:hypothetical protein